MSDAAVLTASNLSFAYQRHWWTQPRQIISVSTFSVERGKRYALVGKNGSGKSTLLKLMAGFLKPQEGTITHPGKSIVYVPPVCHLPEFLTVASVLRYTCAWSGTQYDKSAPLWLELFQLNDLEQCTVSELSFGMRQRLMLAQAFIQTPDLILLDEPFSGIDHDFFSLLEKLLVEWSGRITIIYVAHRYLAPETNYIMLLENKRIVIKPAPFNQRYLNDTFRQRDQETTWDRYSYQPVQRKATESE